MSFKAPSGVDIRPLILAIFPRCGRDDVKRSYEDEVSLLESKTSESV